MVASAEASGKPETGNLKPESEIFRPLPSVLRPLMGSRADFGAHQQAADEMQDRVAAFEARHHDVLRDAARGPPGLARVVELRNVAVLYAVGQIQVVPEGVCAGDARADLHDRSAGIICDLCS